MSRPTNRQQIRAHRRAARLFRWATWLMDYPWLRPVAFGFADAAVDLYEWAAGHDLAVAVSLYEQVDEPTFRKWLVANDKIQDEREDVWAENEY